jgi:UTP--glucose-1-phosphate uridylyltransferase
MSIRKAVIPAAGLGTRFLPATKVQPKEMLPIVDKPVIQYIVEEAAASGITQIVAVTSAHKHAIEDHFDRAFELEYHLWKAGKTAQLEQITRLTELVDIVYVRQKEPLGNGHAVLCARDVIGDEPFAVLWGDDIVVADPPCLRQMIDVHDRHGHAVLAAMSVPLREAPRCGMIAPGIQVEERLWRVADLVEKPSVADAPSTLAHVKGSILTPAIFLVLESTPAGQGGEIWLVDAIRTLLRREAVDAFAFAGRRYDAGNVGEYVAANVDLALQRHELRGELLAHLRRIVRHAGGAHHPGAAHLG